MKPKSRAVKRRLAPIVLVLSSQLMAQPAGDMAAHLTENEVKDSVKAALPFLEDKVASTIVDGASSPIAFHGQAQFRTLFHRYADLPDSSFLGLTRQGYNFGADDPFLRLGLVITPGRNTVLWGTAGFMASFNGVNSKGFMNPVTKVNKTTGVSLDSMYTPVFQHHSANKKHGLVEDMSAGIAIRTKPASFMLKMGAMNWNEASPLSVWKSQPRMFAWEYLPYEIEESIFEYYGYNIAKGEKAGRAAWNKKAFQGVDFAVTDIAGGFGGYIVYGVGLPYDNFERNSMDMAVDLGYAGDSGPIVETGIGDSYRKQLFYRLTKTFNPSVNLGLNNLYVITDKDIVGSGFTYDYLFNSKFDIGSYNSTWKVGNETVKITDKASFDRIKVGDTAITVGEGYWLEPKVFTVDSRGSMGKKFSYMGDLGFSMVESTFVSISNSSYKKKLTKNLDTLKGLDTLVDIGTDGYVEPGTIYGIRKSKSMDYSDVSGYLQVKYSSKVDATIELLYAGNEFYSPNSFVLPTDVFFARGSNLLGAQKFLAAEASPYAKNMFAVGTEIKPNLPWYGHLKVKYGINSQLKAGRDILYFPYRINGGTVISTFNNFYSKWGLGKITETYDFNNHQGINEKKLKLAKAPVDRVGDESYGTIKSGRTINSPTSGGMRGDNSSLFEGFVPYTKVEDLIFNHFSKSSLVEQKRDLSQIWDDEKFNFADKRDAISFVRIDDGKSVLYYSYNKASDKASGNMVVRSIVRNDSLKSDTTIVDSFPVSTISETGFVPVTKKSSFDLSLDWGLDISKYVGYKNDLFLSFYYELNGITKGLKPLAIDEKQDDVLLVSHYIRSEPAIALTKKFYVLGLFGFERWSSNHAWVVEKDTTGKFIGFTKKPISTTDLALGIGFDWDMMKRVGLHGRYKWGSHEDKNVPDMRFKNHTIAFELKSYF